VARLTTYLDLESLEIQTGFDFKLNLTSAIGNLANHDILASYGSCLNAVAYDTRPHKQSCQTKKSCEKKPLIRKIISCHDPGGHERCKDSITIKKRTIL
jgi:hypothetical protein